MRDSHLVTAVACCLMNECTAWLTERLDPGADHVLVHSLKFMGWVMTVLSILKATQAEVEVRALVASDELNTRKF